MVRSQPPTVEMLWEASDPDDTLRRRFGHGSPRAAATWVASALDELWGLRDISCDRIVLSDTNGLAWVTTPSGRLIAKWSVAPDRFPRLAALAELTTWLAAEGLPVSAPVAAADGRVQVERDGVSLGLQRVVAGDHLDPADAVEVRAVGAMLAHLHDALVRSPVEVPGTVAPEASLADRVGGWLDAAPAHTPGAARDTLRRLVAGAPGDQLPVQLVHGDVRSANVLCADQQVRAVLDLEEARFDHRVVELARAATLLGTRFHDWAPVPLEVHRQLLDGYESVRLLTPDESAWWPVLVLWSTLRMVPAEDPTGWGASASALALASGC